MALRLVFPALLVLAGCSAHAPANESADAVVANATENYEDTVRDADDRADRLDELSGELDQAANQVGGTAGRNLRNESATDQADAAAIRARGQRDGEQDEDAIENRAGLLNSQ